MHEEPRKCACGCGRLIVECMGVCKAGDVEKILKGETTMIRELHGYCAHKLQWTASGQLVPRTPSVAS